MKKIILIPLALILLISCQPAPKKKAPTAPTEPTTAYCRLYTDDCELMLAKLFRKVYNPNGYQIKTLDGKGPVFIIPEELHNKMQIPNNGGKYYSAEEYLIDEQWLYFELRDCKKDTCIISRY